MPNLYLFSPFSAYMRLICSQNARRSLTLNGDYKSTDCSNLVAALENDNHLSNSMYKSFYVLSHILPNIVENTQYFVESNHRSR